MYYQISQEGFYLGVKSESNERMEFFTDVPITGNFVKFRLVNDEWVEGASQQDIDEHRQSQVPFEVPLWRVRAVLKLLGKEEDIQDALSHLSEPTKTGAEYIWKYGTVIERNSQTVLFLQYILQMTDEEVDNIFIQANNIQI